MKLRDLFAGIPFCGEWYDETAEITSVTADSRQVQPGGLFAALPGPNRDGGDFIAQALERGAAAVLCERPRIPPAPGWWWKMPAWHMRKCAQTGLETRPMPCVWPP